MLVRLDTKTDWFHSKHDELCSKQCWLSYRHTRGDDITLPALRHGGQVSLLHKDDSSMVLQ